MFRDFGSLRDKRVALIAGLTLGAACLPGVVSAQEARLVPAVPVLGTARVATKQISSPPGTAIQGSFALGTTSKIGPTGTALPLSASSDSRSPIRSGPVTQRSGNSAIEKGNIPTGVLGSAP
jgi:hypothetical protein